MDPDTEVDLECLPFLRLYKSGRVERFMGTDIVPASIDPATGVSSKDIAIDPDIGVSARLYLPNLSNSPTKKLPILVYYHGGAFIIESAFSPTYHNFLNPIAAQAGFIIVSIDYRRAPEHPLPSAHDDSWTALEWVASHASGGPEAWLAKNGDFSRLFLAGDSAGGNLAHYVAVRAGSEGLQPLVKIQGLALIHPYFSGGSGPKDPAVRARSEAIWRIVRPGTTSLDDPIVDELTGPKRLDELGCRRVVVFVAEKDSLRRTGVAYYEKLVGSGWGGEAELVETEGEEHVFHLVKPTCEKAVAQMERLVSFLKKE